MKRLILMRHAKSDWGDPMLPDHDRPLNKRGRRAASALGHWMREAGLRPDQILCSSATRTQETCARLALPFLAQAMLRPETHSGLDRAVAVLSMQTVITGPAPPEAAGLGRQGPISFDTRVQPLTDTTVRAIDRALGTRPDVGASLRAAPALAPRPPEAPTARNPRPDQALLTMGIFAYLALAGWLLVRRGPGGPPRHGPGTGSTAGPSGARPVSSSTPQTPEH